MEDNEIRRYVESSLQLALTNLERLRDIELGLLTEDSEGFSLGALKETTKHIGMLKDILSSYQEGIIPEPKVLSSQSELPFLVTAPADTLKTPRKKPIPVITKRDSSINWESTIRANAITVLLEYPDGIFRNELARIVKRRITEAGIWDPILDTEYQSNKRPRFLHKLNKTQRWLRDKGFAVVTNKNMSDWGKWQLTEQGRQVLGRQPIFLSGEDTVSYR